jgi:cellulose synthase/poly-beta-1,6-N-acetylglucosamine synthase-like glycosyltransferase
MRAAFVIAAHNEAAIIADTTRQLAAHADALYVIADHCTDDTARLAAEAGARVYERHEPGVGGKGAALAWFVEVAAGELESFGYLVVLDADTRLADGFVPAMSACFAAGALAAQGFVCPAGAEQSPASALAAYSELLSQRIGDKIRARLGWTVALRGTGMAFRPAVLREIVGGLRTQVEDVEMSLRLARKGVRVHFVPEAIIYDPKPPDAGRVSRQRARWLHGLAQVWAHYWRAILRLAFMGGPQAWSLLWALLVKPKALIFAAKACLFALACLLSLIVPGPALLLTLLAGLIGLSLAVDLAYYLAGLLLVQDRRLYARALVRAPLYLMVWLRSMGLMRFSEGRWLRARD